MNGANEREEKLTLDLLNAIDKQSDLSQRHLARQMGVALGLANSYLKRCARKGLVKVSEAPANRYLYYLTPKGFAEKARLTGRYLANSLTFYRKAGDSCSRAYRYCNNQGKNRVLLYGISDLAEIAMIRALEESLEVIGVFDPESELEQYFSKPIWTEFSEVDEFDLCLLTKLDSPFEAYLSLIDYVGKDKLWVPDVLGIKVKGIGQE